MGEETKQADIVQESDKQGKVYWHDAFATALELELYDYADSLTFESEYQLNKKALEVDVLVIKKTADTLINKNIGKIFKRVNLFEYKSETDNLTVWDYNKAIAYAMLYSAHNEVPKQDITVSFVVTPKPIKLFDYLENVNGVKITEAQTGIYYLNDTVTIQIIESKILSAEENVFLKNLRSNLTRKDVSEVLNAYEKYGKIDKINIYLNRIAKANKAIFMEVFEVSATAREAFCDLVKEIGLEEQIEQRGREDSKRETALKMLKKGFDLNDISEVINKPIEWIQSIAT
ncbi:MAG: hypothetical protein LBI27_06420 [Clostridiales bacterium]|jgi:hypothetical protein|nr:hypothetical protein [Clostridiales bacterium]